MREEAVNSSEQSFEACFMFLRQKKKKHDLHPMRSNQIPKYRLFVILSREDEEEKRDQTWGGNSCDFNSIFFSCDHRFGI